MSLPLETVQHIALLARLGLKSAEIEKMQKDLSEVLGLFQTLERQEIPVVSGRTVKESGSPSRTDQSVTCDEETQSLITKNFPASQEGFLKVRSVF